MPLFFFFNDTATTEIYTLSLHDALPIWQPAPRPAVCGGHRRPLRPAVRAAATGAKRAHRGVDRAVRGAGRSEEHTSELQSPCNLVCRLLLEKKKKYRVASPPRAARTTRR